MKTLYIIISFVLIFLFNIKNVNAKNIYQQIIILFEMEDIHEDGEVSKSIYMNHLINGETYINKVMMDTDSSLLIQQLFFGPFKLEKDPLRDSILKVFDLRDARVKLAYRAWRGFLNEKNDSNSVLFEKIESIKKISNCEIVKIVLLTNSQYYTSYYEKGSNVIVRPAGESSDYTDDFLIHNMNIFDENTSKKIFEGYWNIYPNGHPREGVQYGTLFTFNPSFFVYPTLIKQKDEDGWLLPAGEELKDVLNSDSGWNLNNYYNKIKSK